MRGASFILQQVIYRGISILRSLTLVNCRTHGLMGMVHESLTAILNPYTVRQFRFCFSR